jgi:hypothetical protein
MKSSTKEKLKISASLVLSCIWHVFEGLYEWIVFVADAWGSEWRSAKNDWAIADAMKD